ncbi:MAG: hypothetical protein LBW85_04260 [Deltaproteobacteria bacterium]|jgi:hypothetical protein|nr:hypothetical protein [Deltaproteobacteria bacterium]
MSRKKVIWALAAVFLLSAFRPAGASAESPVTFSGYLRLRTFALGGFPDNAPGNPDYSKKSDRYAVTRLRVNVSFKPTDNIEVRWRFQGPNAARWGTTDSSETGPFSLYSVYFYGVIKTSWGTISAGRVSYDIDSAGLRTLGYLPTWGFNTSGNIFDRDSENDGILYQNEWENGFGLRAFYVKRAHQDPVYVADNNPQNPLYPNGTYEVKDGDYDRFSVEPYYKWGTGGVSLAVQYDRNKYNWNNYDRSFPAAGNFDPSVGKSWAVTLNPAFYQSWKVGQASELTVHAEAKYAFGKRQRHVAGADWPAQKQDGFGAYLDLRLDYPQGDATLAGWYFRGNDEGPGSHYWQNPNTATSGGAADHSLVHGGEGFYPFILFYYGNNFLTGSADRSLEGNQAPGHWGAGILGNHNFNEFVQLNWGVGTFGRTADYIHLDGSKASRALGTEVNLGLTVKILDNLQWQTKFAVLDLGSYYGDRYSPDNPSRYNGTVWGWANEFLFTF